MKSPRQLKRPKRQGHFKVTLPVNSKKMLKYRKITHIMAVVAYYLIGIGFILLFWYLHTSQDTQQFLGGLNTTSGFRVTIFFGIIKLLSAILGITITAAVTYKITKDLKKQR